MLTFCRAVCHCVQSALLELPHLQQSWISLVVREEEEVSHREVKNQSRVTQFQDLTLGGPAASLPSEALGCGRHRWHRLICSRDEI